MKNSMLIPEVWFGGGEEGHDVVGQVPRQVRGQETGQRGEGQPSLVLNKINQSEHTKKSPTIKHVVLDYAGQ